MGNNGIFLQIYFRTGMPYVTQVAVGKLKELGVFGNDYDTPDGT